MKQFPMPRLDPPARKTLWPWLAAILIFLIAFGATSWRLDKAPDIFTDEILYTRAGIRVAGEGALVWDTGRPIYVHPPLYFLGEAAYWQLSRAPASPLLAAGDIFASVYHARYINALLSGLTAATLFLIGRRLHGGGLGLLLVALFVLDPFSLRTNRRAMLETTAALFALGGMAVLLAGRVAPSKRAVLSRALLAGLLLGAALLTKELTFTNLVALSILGLWEFLRYRQAGAQASTPLQEQATSNLGRLFALEALVAVSTAALTYSLYPLWMLLSGNWAGFAEVKWLSLQRLVGLVHLSGWNRSGVSLVDSLTGRLADYGSSYLLLALGGLATLWLLRRHRGHRSVRLLAAWGLTLYPFYGFVALFGSGNDQFFYFLLIPAILILGYSVSLLVFDAGALQVRRRFIVAGSLFLVLILSFNFVSWWSAYGVGLDNAYHQFVTDVNDQIPQDAALNATGDTLKFQYFFPGRPITSAATPEEARVVGVQYLALAPKDVRAHYGRVTPELAFWLESEGQQLYTATGDSYGQISLYQVEHPDSPTPLVEAPEAEARQRSFAPAQSGFVGTLALVLGLWIGLVGGSAIWLGKGIVPPPVRQVFLEWEARRERA